MSSVLFNAETTQRRTASVGPGSANHDFFDEEDGRMYVPRARSRGAVREIDSARSSRRTSIDLSVRNDDGSPEIPPYSFHPPPSHTPEWTLPGQNLTPGHLETVDEYPGLPSTSSEASTRCEFFRHWYYVCICPDLPASAPTHPARPFFSIQYKVIPRRSLPFPTCQRRGCVLLRYSFCPKHGAALPTAIAQDCSR